MSEIASFTLKPIGVARTPFTDKMAAPRQPRAAKGVRGTIELYPGERYEFALQDLEGWEYVWVLFVFHRALNWRPKVLPPRSKIRRGVFSTRTPHRPNPIGMSVVKLVSVKGRVLEVEDVDLLDETPVLDIKPYVPWADAIPNARTGWLSPEVEGESDEDGRPGDPRASWRVELTDLAAEQFAFIAANDEGIEGVVRQSLSLGPHAHPYRRIKKAGAGFKLAHKTWRMLFEIADSEQRVLRITRVYTGYRAGEFEAGGEAPPVHHAFTAKWGVP